MDALIGYLESHEVLAPQSSTLDIDYLIAQEILSFLHRTAFFLLCIDESAEHVRHIFQFDIRNGMSTLTQSNELENKPILSTEHTTMNENTESGTTFKSLGGIKIDQTEVFHSEGPYGIRHTQEANQVAVRPMFLELSNSEMFAAISIFSFYSIRSKKWLECYQQFGYEEIEYNETHPIVLGDSDPYICCLATEQHPIHADRKIRFQINRCKPDTISNLVPEKYTSPESRRLESDGPFRFYFDFDVTLDDRNFGVVGTKRVDIQVTNKEETHLIVISQVQVIDCMMIVLEIDVETMEITRKIEHSLDNMLPDDLVFHYYSVRDCIVGVPPGTKSDLERSAINLMHGAKKVSRARSEKMVCIELFSGVVREIEILPQLGVDALEYRLVGEIYGMLLFESAPSDHSKNNRTVFFGRIDWNENKLLGDLVLLDVDAEQEF